MEAHYPQYRPLSKTYTQQALEARRVEARINTSAASSGKKPPLHSGNARGSILTRRERELLSLLAEGLSDAEAKHYLTEVMINHAVSETAYVVQACGLLAGSGF